LDPELILVNGPDAPIMDEEPYASTTAGREGNAVVVEVQWLNQPAPRSVIVATSSIADAVEAYNAESDDGTESADDGDGETGSDDGDTEAGSDGDDESAGDGATGTGDEAPGFGVVAAVLAVLATLAVGVSRRP
jgi:iron complex transport system substrate-binding protein